MINMFNMFQEFKNYSYADSKIAEKYKINGLIVSTANTPDEGYETAIIDKDDVYPVERYSSLEEAEKGHEKWKISAKTLEKITALGDSDGWVSPKEIILKRI